MAPYVYVLMSAQPFGNIVAGVFDSRIGAITHAHSWKTSSWYILEMPLQKEVGA